MRPALFANRSEAGRRLGSLLAARLPAEPVVVLGLPRGGVPVVYEIANALAAPLDVIIVRKLGVPDQPELAMGAIGEGNVRIVNRTVVTGAAVDDAEFAAVEARERHELARRASQFRGRRDRVPLTGCATIIADDGIATGATARAACEVARALGAMRVILAAPVAPRGAIEDLRSAADEVVVLEHPEAFSAIGEFYDDFTQTSDDEVVRLLDMARARSGTERHETG